MNEAKTFHTKIPKIASVEQKKKPRFSSINVPIQQKMVRRKKNCFDMDLVADLAGDVGAIFCTIEAL
jgi:hypothetical protein